MAWKFILFVGHVKNCVTSLNLFRHKISLNSQILKGWKSRNFTLSPYLRASSSKVIIKIKLVGMSMMILCSKRVTYLWNFLNENKLNIVVNAPASYLGGPGF
jgi:hypothetical protein